MSSIDLIALIKVIGGTSDAFLALIVKRDVRLTCKLVTSPQLVHQSFSLVCAGKWNG